jgi:hypothetical protein
MRMRHIGDDQRRARLAVRHALAPGARVADPLAATHAMTVLHATEAASVHLAVHARVDGVTVEDVDEALYDDRTLVKQLAMRRTLFVFPRDLLPAAWGSASARVAAQQETLVARDVVRHGIADDGEAWLARARAAVLSRLADGAEVPAQQLREELPELSGSFVVSPEKKYGGEFSIAPRVLGLLGARGDIVRARNGGHWRLSRPAWTTMAAWLGEAPAPLPEQEGYRELVRRWLWTFGPGTEADLVWWLGATKTVVRRALADLAALEVALDGDDVGWVLPGDDEPVPEVEPWAALLPVLDPTTMGWRQRGHYLDPGHTPYLFDTNGNAGTTAWWDGRIVGCWVQDDDGVVRTVLSEDVDADGLAALAAEAERLTGWLDGVRIGSVYQSLQMRHARLP